MTPLATSRERASREIITSRANKRPPTFAVTLVALAIVFALAWMFFLRSGPSASAPVVAGVRGTYTWLPGPGSITHKGSFSAGADGNAGGTMRPGGLTLGLSPSESAYSVTTKTESTYGGAGIPRYTRTIGAWPPAWRVATHSPLDYQGLAAVVRTAVEEGDEAVGIKPVKDGDRAAWRASMTLDGEQIDLVVDQQTGIVTWYSDGASTFTANVDWESPPAAGETYAVDVPTGAEVETIGGTEPYEKSPAEAGRTAGYAPLVSDLAPDGYGLRAIATIHAELRPVSWISEKVWNLPVGLRGTAVMELYTRGLAHFTVEQVGPATLRSLDGVSDWQDEVGTGRLAYQQTTLQFGAFKGRTASTWYQESGPSLFVAGRRRAVFVTGALTRQELVAFAEGLKPVPATQ